MRLATIIALLASTAAPTAAAQGPNKSDQTPGILSLPSAGGTVQKEEGELATPGVDGSLGFTLTIDTPRGPRGSHPELNLRYATRAGDGSFGLGWTLNIPAVLRDLSRGVPDYKAIGDGTSADHFLYNGARLIADASDHPGRFRMERDSGFTSVAYTDETLEVADRSFPGGWTTRDATGTLYVFPNDACAVVHDGDEDTCGSGGALKRVSRWNLRFAIDRAGNVTEYRYQRSHGDLVLHEVIWGPHAVTFEALPAPRPDRTLSMLAGYPVPKAALIGGARVYRHGRLDRRYCFVYRAPKSEAGATTLQLPDCAVEGSTMSPYARGSKLLNTMTYLESVRSWAGEGAYRDAALRHPEIAFGYSPWFEDDVEGAERRLVYKVEGFERAIGGDGSLNDLLDVNHDGLPDIVNMQGSRIRFKLNPGQTRPAEVAAELKDFPQQSFSTDLKHPSHMIADMDGDGFADYVLVSSGSLKYYRAIGGGTEQAHGFSADAVHLAAPPGFALDALVNGSARLVDLDADGRTDVLGVVALGGNRAFVALLNRDGVSFDKVVKPLSDGHRARVSSDTYLREEKVQIDDLNADGLLDILELDGNQIRIFYNLGTARQEGQPLFGVPDGVLEDAAGGFRVALSGVEAMTRRSWLIDANGDGLADLVLLNPGNDREVRVRLNRGYGNFARHADYAVRDPQFSIGSPVGLSRVADVDGDGQAEVVYRSGSAVFMMDLNRAAAKRQLIKSGLLTRVLYETGKQIDVQYASSTDEFERNRAEGREVSPGLAFPVLVVKRIVTTMGSRAPTSFKARTQEYLYANGYYDGTRREFQGFARVSSLEYGDDSQGIIAKETQYHVGRDDDGGWELTGHEAWSRTFALKDERYLTQQDATSRFIDSAFVHSLSEYAANQAWPVAAATPVASVSTTWTAVRRSGGEVFVCPSARTELAYADERSFGRTTHIVCNDHGQVIERRVEPAGNAATPQPERVRIETSRFDASYAQLGGRHIYDSPDSTLMRDASGRKLAETVWTYEDRGLVRTERLWIEDERYAGETRQHDVFGNLHVSRSDGGRIVVIDHDTAGVHPLRVTNALGHEWKAAWTCEEVGEELARAGLTCRETDRPLAVEDPNGIRTLYSYDAMGRLTRSVSSIGEDRVHEYRVGQDGEYSRILTVTRLTREGGIFEQVAFVDALGEEVAQLGQARSGQSRVETFVERNRRRLIRYEYLPFFVPEGVRELFESGELPAPESKRSETIYDALGRPTKTRKANGTIVTYRYEADADEKTIEFAAGPNLTRRDTVTSLATYDHERRVVSVSDPAGRTYSFVYDAQGGMISVADPSGSTIEMARNGLGLKASVKAPGIGEQRYHYDVGQRLDRKTIIDRAGATAATIELRYDALDRIVAKLVDGDVREEFDYDSKPSAFATEGACFAAASHSIGRLTRAAVRGQAVGVATIFGWSPKGIATCRRVEVGADGFDERTEVDFLGRRTRVVDPHGYETRYEYAEDQFLDKIPGLLEHLEYDEKGQLQRIDYGGHRFVTSYDYDPSTLLVSRIRTVRADGQVLQDLVFRINGMGEVERIDDELQGIETHVSLTAEYGYDKSGMLTSTVQGATGESLVFEYDIAGNFVRNPLFSAEAMTPPNSAAPYEPRGTPTDPYRFDTLGRLASSPKVRSTSWSAEGRLQSLITADGKELSFAYDHEGRRVWKRALRDDGGSIDVYPTESFHIEAALPVSYVHAGDERLARVEHRPEGDRIFWYLREHLESTQDVLTSDGTLVEQTGYYPYGKELQQPLAWLSLQRLLEAQRPVAVPYRYTGHWRDDETELYYTGARYYDPALGRFVSPDPLVLEKPEGCVELLVECNFYTYSRNNPLKFKDPSGNAAHIAIAGAVGGIISGASTLIEEYNANGGKMTGAAWGKTGISFGSGFAKGALAATGIGAVGVIGGSAAINFIEQAGSAAVDMSQGKKVSAATIIGKAVLATAVDGLNAKIGNHLPSLAQAGDTIAVHSKEVGTLVGGAAKEGSEFLTKVIGLGASETLKPLAIAAGSEAALGVHGEIIESVAGKSFFPDEPTGAKIGGDDTRHPQRR